MAQCIRLNPPLLKSYSRAGGNHPAGKWSHAPHFQGISFYIVLSDRWLSTLVRGKSLGKGRAHAAAW